MRGRTESKPFYLLPREGNVGLLPPPVCPVSRMFPVSRSRYLTGKQTRETVRFKAPADLPSQCSLPVPRREGGEMPPSYREEPRLIVQRRTASKPSFSLLSLHPCESWRPSGNRDSFFRESEIGTLRCRACPSPPRCLPARVTSSSGEGRHSLLCGSPLPLQSPVPQPSVHPALVRMSHKKM